MSAGRPRTFDMEQALECALQVFWRQSYEGASLADLTEAMGINRPSLYAAFGSKEGLFRKVLERYVSGPGAYARAALCQPTAYAVVQHMLQDAIDTITHPSYPPGCLTVQGALSGGAETAPIQQALMAHRTALELGLRERLECAKAEGDLPSEANPSDLARYLMVLIQGMSVQAVSGATKEELQRVAQMAVQGLPLRMPNMTPAEPVVPA